MKLAQIIRTFDHNVLNSEPPWVYTLLCWHFAKAKYYVVNKIETWHVDRNRPTL